MDSARKCEVVQEIAYLPGGPNGWKKTLNQALEHPNIKEWAYILHDKDIDNQGNPIAPHVHIVIILHDSVKYSTIGGYIGVPAQYVQSIKQRIRKGKHYQSDVGGALSYLTHRNAKDKHQYDDSEVVAKPGFDWLNLRAKSEQAQAEQRSLTQIYKDIEAGKIREYNLFSRITMSAYIDNKIDIDRAFEYRKGMLRLDYNRKIDVIYICGEPGAGKTTLAKQFCEKRGYSYCLSGSSRDPLQEYHGQDVLILDDLRPDVFPLADLLKLLDNHSASSASARYRDRWLEVKLILVTTIRPLEGFYACLPDHSEPIQQLKRRCRTMITLNKSALEIYQYNDIVEDYVHMMTAENPVAKLHMDTPAEISDRAILHDLCADLGVAYPFKSAS